MYPSARPVMSALSAVRLRWPVTPAAGLPIGMPCGAGEPRGGEGWFQARMPAASIFGEPHFFQGGIDPQPSRADHPAAGLGYWVKAYWERHAGDEHGSANQQDF